jgi:RNA polymerase sigma-70 factor (sigma-E family)
MSMPSRGQLRPQTDPDLRSLYQEHRWDLVRLASLLLNDPADAEEVVQDAFVKAYLAWGRLREPDKALSYLRSIVLNGARSRMRHLRVVSGDEQRRMIAALRSLPDRQRECLALRYYLDLPEAEIAATLGISAGSVKTHVHRGLAALSTRVESVR